MGPLANEPQYRKVVSFFASAASEGATVAASGRPEERLGGYFVQPTVLTNVKPTMTVACEEVFGPVLAVIPGRAHRRHPGSLHTRLKNSREAPAGVGLAPSGASPGASSRAALSAFTAATRASRMMPSP
jgi:hypothetical protein